MDAGRTRVKICGLCSAEDAMAAVKAGADAVGVVFVESARQVSLDEAEAVFADVPPFVTRVAVFADPSADEVAEAVERLQLGAVQLHGAEPPAFCAGIAVPVIKAFRVGEGYAPSEVEAYRGSISAVLLDTYVPGEAGGTGRAFVWDRALMPEGLPVVVAGGLDPGNVAEAVHALRPYAVDVSSGVEARLRVKDVSKMAAFAAAVAKANKEAA